MMNYLIKIALFNVLIYEINSVWIPPPGTLWQWQLKGKLNTTVDATVYDIDYYESTKEQVQELHQKGRKVFCYISIGSWEKWRNDAKDFPKNTIGKEYPGWPDEKFIDIRSSSVKKIMAKRFDICKDKGFDGIEGDNLDSYQTDTGFTLSKNDAINYGIWLANEAHSRGLSFGQKNAPDLVGALVDHMDWALTESCGAGSEPFCHKMAKYVESGKAVFDCEYTDKGFATACSMNSVQLSVLRKNRDLTAWYKRCA